MTTIIPKGLILSSILFALIESKLILVHVIFRHGERTPDTFAMSPNDPYKNESFYPYGNGQLINLGKKSMYNFGKELRKRYQEFLGDIYSPDLVDPWASPLPRTQAGLQLVLASLFPPNDLLIWEENLSWQPITYNFFPRKQDKLFASILQDDYKKMYYEHCKSEEAKPVLQEAALTLSIIRNHSGLPAETPRDFFFFYITLNVEDHYGLTLPQWTNAIYPHPLKEQVHLEFQLEMSTRKLKKELVGVMMKKILTDTENRVAGKTNYKLHMYSSHEVNVIHALIFLGLMYQHFPGYTACIALEVHEENGDYSIEVHYKEDKYSNYELLQFENGEKRMSFERFRNMVQELEESNELDDITSSNSKSKWLETRIMFLSNVYIICFSVTFLYF